MLSKRAQITGGFRAARTEVTDGFFTDVQESALICGTQQIWAESHRASKPTVSSEERLSREDAVLLPRLKAQPPARAGRVQKLAAMRIRQAGGIPASPKRSCGLSLSGVSL